MQQFLKTASLQLDKRYKTIYDENWTGPKTRTPSRPSTALMPLLLKFT